MSKVTPREETVYLHARCGTATHVTVAFTGPVSKREINKVVQMLGILFEGMPEYLTASDVSKASEATESVFLEMVLPSEYLPKEQA